MIGIFHCSGGEDISYYDFASKYVKSLGYSEGLVNAVLCKKEGARYTSLSSNYHKGL